MVILLAGVVLGDDALSAECSVPGQSQAQQRREGEDRENSRSPKEKA
jgi:hypothetical protein